MNDFTKQIQHENKYKELRNNAIEQYTGDFDSTHYKVVNDSNIKATHIISNDIYKTTYKEDFDTASKDFWQKNVPNAIQKYNGGSLTATFGPDIYTVEELLNRVSNFIKDSISNELLIKKLSPTLLADNFNAVKIALMLLSKTLNNIDNNIDIIGMSAYLHGFINTYIHNVIKEKIQKEKYKNKGNVSI